MNILVDTNLLVALIQPAHVHHVTAASATTGLTAAGHRLVIVPQNLYEFWVIVTRPVQANGLGLDTPAAQSRSLQLRGSMVLLGDVPQLYGAWEQLVIQHDVKGKPAHDARLAAAMLVHRIDAILTFNGRDFTRYAGVRVLDPAAVAAGTAP